MHFAAGVVCIVAMNAALPAATTAPAETPATPLKDLKLALDDLKNLPSLEYHLASPRPNSKEFDLNPRATFKSTTSVEANAVVYTDTPPLTTTKRTCAKDNYLSLKSLDMDSGGVKKHKDVADGKITCVFEGQTYSAILPDETLSGVAFLRIATLLPKKAGSAWSVPHFIPGVLGASGPAIMSDAYAKLEEEHERMRVKYHLPKYDPSKYYPTFVDEAVIRCVGPETITTAGKPTDCTKFTVEVKATKAIVMTVWLTSNGTVKQFQPQPDTLYVLPD